MIAAFLAAATAFVAADELPGIDTDALTSMIRRELHLPDDSAWDAAFVQHIGYCSHYDHETGASRWPLPAVATAHDLTTIARQHDLARTEPRAGDVFAVWSPVSRRFVRSGIIASVEACLVGPTRTTYECVTLEGDLNERADGRGPLVRRVRRSLSPHSGDCFIRWVDALDDREQVRMAA